MDEAKLKDCISKDGTYIIPVVWSVFSTVTVHAENLADALKLFNERCDELPLSTAAYIDDSYHIDAENADSLIAAQKYAPVGGVVINKDGSISQS